MLFIVQFEDKQGVSDLRQKLMAEHFAFLDSRKDKVLVAGSVREIPSDRPLGGLWIATEGSTSGVKRINRWVKAFPDRKTLI